MKGLHGLYILDWQILDALCGLRSNIPECCVKFWILQNRKYGPLSDIARLSPGWTSHKHAYVACPNCLKTGKVNKLRTCKGCIGVTTDAKCIDKTNLYKNSTELSVIQWIIKGETNDETN